MVKLELSDKALLGLNAGTSLVYGAHALATPRHFEDWTFGPPLTGHNDSLCRMKGHSMASLGALTLVAARHLSGDTRASKDWFRTSGAIFGTAAAMSATNAYRHKERRDAGYINAAVFGTLAALNLWRGFKPASSKVSV